MRYFLNTSTLKPITVGGYSFEFEPVGLRGGSWLGVLAVADPAAASALASICGGTIDEISEQKYQQEKKKESALNNSPDNLLNPPVPEPQLAIADHVARPIAPTVTKQNSTEMITPITLLTTNRQPPEEPLLAVAAARKPKFW